MRNPANGPRYKDFRPRIFNNRKISGYLTRLIEMSVNQDDLLNHERLMLAQFVDGICCAMGLPRFVDNHHPMEFKRLTEEARWWLYSNEEQYFLSYLFLCDYFHLPASKYRSYVERVIGCKRPVSLVAHDQKHKLQVDLSVEN